MRILAKLIAKSVIGGGTLISLGLLSVPVQAINITNNSTSQTSQATSSSVVVFPPPTERYCDLILKICACLAGVPCPPPPPPPPPTAVPWETDALPVIGSTILFGFGVWAKRKSVKPLKK